MLTLDKRPARIGLSINTRTEKHGEESVPAMDIPLTGILLTKDEVNALLDDKHAWDSLYVERKGKPSEPMFAKTLKPFAHVGKWKGSAITLYVGMKPEMYELEGKLSRAKLTPQTGGLTALSITVQVTAEDAVPLIHFLDSAIDVELEFGDETDEEGEEDQPELNLGTKAKSDDAAAVH